VITSAVDPAAMSNPMAKTVARVPGAWLFNYGKAPLTALLPSLVYLGTLGALWLLKSGRTGLAFVASALALAGVIGTAGASMFPFVMPSSSVPQASLTVWDSVSSHMTLAIMFWVTLVFMPLILFYTSWAYKVMSGKLTAAYIRRNDHATY
jgi:cytochrome d ubiquinol oxidase subunit II